MRKSNRHAKSLAILAAAAGLTTSLQLANATTPSFTWNNPTSGSWSTPATNWVGSAVPATGGATNYDLLFRSAAASAYTSFNDFAGNFSLGVLRFNVTSTGPITLSGNPLSFNGGNANVASFNGTSTGAININNTLVFNGDGSGDSSILSTGTTSYTGTVTLAGPLTSTVAPAANNGAAVQYDRASGTLALSGGGSLHSLRIENGNVNFTGGSLSLSSHQREADDENDATEPSSGGFWSLGVGASNGTTGNARLTITGGTLNTTNMFAGIQAGDNGTIIMNGAHVNLPTVNDGDNDGRMGTQDGNGTISILNGSVVNNRRTHMGRGIVTGDGHDAGTPTFSLTVDNSTLNTGFLVLPFGIANGDGTISGGSIVNGLIGTEVATAADSSGSPLYTRNSLTVKGGSQLNGGGVLYVGASGDGLFDFQSSTMNCSTILMGDLGSSTTGSGTTLISGSSTLTASDVIVMGSATRPDVFTISGGAVVDNTSNANGVFYMSVQGPAEQSIFTVTGTGSKFLTTQPNQVATSWDVGNVTTVNVLAGGEFTMDESGSGGWLVSEQFSGKTTINVTGGSQLNLIGTDGMRLGDDVNDATLLFDNSTGVINGQLSMATLGDVPDDPDRVGPGHSTLNVTNHSTLSNPGGMVMSGLYADGSGTPIPGGSATLNVSGGSTVTTGFMIISNNDSGPTAGTGASTVNISGAGSSVTVDTGTDEGQVLMSLGLNTSSTLSVGAGSTFSVKGAALPAQNFFSFLTATASDSTSVITNNGTIAVEGDAVHGWDGRATMTNTGTFTVSGSMLMGLNNTETSTLHGAGTINNNGGTISVGDELDVGDDGFGSINMNGGRLTVGSTMFMGALASPVSGGFVNVANATLTVGDQLQIGGAGGTLGGASTLNLSNGTLNVGTGGTGLLALYSNSTMTIGSTAVIDGDTAVDGVINYNSGVFKTNGELSVGGKVLLSSAGRNGAGTPSNKKTLEAGSLTFAAYNNLGTGTANVAAGLVDLNDNDALFHSNSISGNGSLDVRMAVRSGRNGGNWLGQGIVSTAAKNEAQGKTNLAVLSGAEYRATAAHAGTTSFNGRALVNTDTIVKYTFNGDADADGHVTGADYSRTDNGFNNHLSGWVNGDYNYDGVVNGSDYGMMDFAYTNQGVVTLARPGDTLAGPADPKFVSTGLDGAQTVSAAHLGSAGIESGFTDHNIAEKFGREKMNITANAGDDAVGGSTGSRAVPEPSMIGLAGLSLMGALSRRRRSSR